MIEDLGVSYLGVKVRQYCQDTMHGDVGGLGGVQIRYTDNVDIRILSTLSVSQLSTPTTFTMKLK